MLIGCQGASKLALSTFSSEELWKETGRLDSSNSEVGQIIVAIRRSFRVYSFFDLRTARGASICCHRPTKRRSPCSLVISSNLTKNFRLDSIKFVRNPRNQHGLLAHNYLARKYRDEPRPRQGLLRTREFLMKDLYTFDISTEEALKTYRNVRQAYTVFFDEFKVPYLTAEASSGDMGGNLSHEYHFPTRKGEDNVISCTSCDYVANEELAESRLSRQRGFAAQEDGGYSHDAKTPMASFRPLALQDEKDVDLEISAQRDENQWIGITSDRNTIVQAYLPEKVRFEWPLHDRGTRINPYTIKNLVPDLDLSVEDPIALFKEHRRLLRVSDKDVTIKPRVLRIMDMRYYLIEHAQNVLSSAESVQVGDEMIPIKDFDTEHGPDDLVRVETGDPCPKCEDGTLQVETAVELGHTFHLGTRYSKPLNTTVARNPTQSPVSEREQGFDSDDRAISTSDQVPIQMGCHGIGVSRLIAAVADSLADSKGLNWPSVMAPFQAVIVPTKGQEAGGAEVYDILSPGHHDNHQNPIDTILDDRSRDFGWKLKDADMIGYPVIVVVGRDWKKERKTEVQCRRLGVKDSVPSHELKCFVEGLLAQL